MKKIVLLFAALLFATPLWAADNAVIVTPGAGVTMKSKDIGAGVQAMQPVLSDTTGAPLSMPTAGADAVSNTATALLNSSRLSIFNGTSWDRLKGDTTNGAFVNVKTSVLPTGAATEATLSTIATNTGASVPAGTAIIGKVGVDQTTPGTTNGVAIVGVNGATALAGNGATGTGSPRVTIASDNSPVAGLGAGATAATAPANATMSGGTAQNAEATAVTNGQLKAFITDLVGKQIVLPYANPENFVSGVISAAMVGITSTSLIGSPGGSLRNYITACTFSNSHATVGTDILLQDGSGGTTIWVVPAAAVYGGAHITFPTPLRQPSTATALFAANVTTGASTKASCSGYKGL